MPRLPHLRQPDYEEKFDFKLSSTIALDRWTPSWCVLLGPPLINLEPVVIPDLPNLFHCQSSLDVRLISHMPGKSREIPLLSYGSERRKVALTFLMTYFAKAKSSFNPTIAIYSSIGRSC